MKKLILVISLTFFSSLCFAKQGPAEQNNSLVTPLFSHDLGGFPGKEGLMLTVDYPPGGSDPIHRHNANVFVYVLEGSIVMQVKGKDAVVLQKGQTFYESPKDIHLVGKNASNTKPAKFLVFFVKDKGIDAVLPVHENK